MDNLANTPFLSRYQCSSPRRISNQVHLSHSSVPDSTSPTHTSQQRCHFPSQYTYYYSPYPKSFLERKLRSLYPNTTASIAPSHPNKRESESCSNPTTPPRLTTHPFDPPNSNNAFHDLDNDVRTWQTILESRHNFHGL